LVQTIKTWSIIGIIIPSYWKGSFPIKLIPNSPSSSKGFQLPFKFGDYPRRQNPRKGFFTQNCGVILNSLKLFSGVPFPPFIEGRLKVVLLLKALPLGAWGYFSGKLGKAFLLELGFKRVGLNILKGEAWKLPS